MKNEKGVALFITIALSASITILILAFSKDVLINYTTSARAIHRVQAYYAAKSGIEISRLRIKIYQEVKKKFAKDNPLLGEQLNLIWQIPFQWPPVLLEGIQVTDVLYKETLKNSLMKSEYNTFIGTEDAKINLTLLADPSDKVLKGIIRSQLIEIFNRKVSSDEVFADKYELVDFEKAIDNLIDWIDKDEISQSGGSEDNDYQDLNYSPENKMLNSLEQIQLVAGMNSDFFSTDQRKYHSLWNSWFKH